MQDIWELLKSQLIKMGSDGSWIFGVATSITVALPAWISQTDWSRHHTVLAVILLAVICMDWLVGSRLAKASPVRLKTSEVAIDSMVRNIIIVAICGIAWGLDYLFGTGSLIYAVATGAFIYHNFYSLMANMSVLGWDKHFPMWLLKWLDDEIQAKTKKYFPKKKEEA